MRRSVIAVIAAGVFLVPVSAGSGRGDEPPMCHGKPATFVGTSGDDTYSYEDIPDGSVIALLGGNDTLDEFEFNDTTVCTGPGNDSVTLSDSFEGERDLIVLDGGSGRDFLGATRDFGFNTDNRLRLLGGSGRDDLNGADKDDRVFGGDGDDDISLGAGDDKAWGEGGDDYIRGSYGRDRMFGGNGDDEIDGDSIPNEWTDRADGGTGIDACEAEIKRRCET